MFNKDFTFTLWTCDPLCQDFDKVVCPNYSTEHVKINVVSQPSVRMWLYYKNICTQRKTWQEHDVKLGVTLWERDFFPNMSFPQINTVWRLLQSITVVSEALDLLGIWYEEHLSSEEDQNVSGRLSDVDLQHRHHTRFQVVCLWSLDKTTHRHTHINTTVWFIGSKL